MAFGQYGFPGGGSATTGYSVAFRSHNHSRGFYAPLQVDGMNEDDLQALANALAGIPGASYVLLSEGQVSQREMSPTVDYEPLPVPPQD